MKKKTIFTGSATALITPFTQNGVDYDAFGRLIEYQIANGTQALVVCGTTGEPATMRREEKAEVIRFAIDRAAHRVPVIVGTGSNCTADAVENSEKAYALGADALLVVTPYYNKCTVKGLIAHYQAVSDATPLPIIVYSVPARTGVNISAEAMLRLAAIENVSAIKEASGNMDQVMHICTDCGNLIDVYSGEDALTLPMLSMGAKGVISVASNIVPAEVQKMCALFFAGDTAGAAQMQFRLYPLIKALFCEVNPIPVKTAASLLGMCSDILRLPLTNMEAATLKQLKDAMKTFGLL